MSAVFGWCQSAVGTRPDAHHDQYRVRIGDKVCGCPGHGESASLVDDSASNEREIRGRKWENENGPSRGVSAPQPGPRSAPTLKGSANRG